MIKVENVTKKYGDITILDDISYEFPNTGITCILGASGSGKTTLLNLLAGFDSNYTGKISVSGTTITDMDSNNLCNYRRDNIGFVFQNYHLLSGYTVQENILLACQLNDKTLEENIKNSNKLLEQLGILEKSNEKIENLSGGQKQRVAIARALINNPKIIFADEPTGALDRATSNEIMLILKNIAKERLVVIITHDKKICDFADEIISIENGKIAVNQGMPHSSEFESPLKTTKVNKASVFGRALKNFKVHLKRYIAISIAIAIGVCSFILSLSSGNMTQKYITEFQEKNTAFNNGYIKGSDSEAIFKLLENDERIENVYYQYKLNNIKLTYDSNTATLLEKLPMPKASEAMSYGTMPRKNMNEIAFSPSLSKKISKNIKSLVGKKVLFEYGDFKKELSVSGIFNAGYDDIFISSDIEMQLYQDKNIGEAFSISYDVKAFDDIVAVSNMLELRGISSKNASQQVYSLQNTFDKLSKLFMILSILVLFIGIFISIILLVKQQNSRFREIGLLSALGFSKSIIRKIILYENTLLSCNAIAINIIFILSIYIVSKVAHFPVLITPMQLLMSTSLTFLIVFLGSFISSQRLIKAEPAEALRM